MTMRVLVLGPVHKGGSLPPYLDVLTSGLRHHGARVTRHGSTQIPYDTAQQRFWPPHRLLAAAQELADAIDPAAHDVIALHFGNLEYDQLVAGLWPPHRRPPLVHHVHTLDPTLLRVHSPDLVLQEHVRRTVHTAQGHVYFGRYAREHLTESSAPGELASGVAWLPTTIPPGTTPSPRPELAAALDTPLPVLSLYGYAAPWKDAALLVSALATMATPARVVLAGDFWDDPAQAGVDLRRFTHCPTMVGSGELVVVPDYLGPADRASLVRASTAGVFPYRRHPSFQGSGAVADYLALGVPIVATDIANMAELIGPAGRIVEPGDPEALAVALSTVVSPGSANTYARRATERSARFTAATHAATCLDIYRRAAARQVISA